MNEDNDPILESALEEVLGGKSPPDLTAQTLARAEAEGSTPESAAGPQSAAGHRPFWRAWGPGLAAAASVVIVAGVVAVASIPMMRTPASETQVASDESAAAGDDADSGASMNADGEVEVTEDNARHGGSTSDSGFSMRRVRRPQESPRVNTATPAEQPGGMNFEGVAANPFVDTEDDNLSTFALEHDTGGYSVVRRYLNDDNLPLSEAVRVEEFVNYFDYDYTKPTVDPFLITADAAPSRYGEELKNSKLMRIGVQAREVFPEQRKPAVLTFVIDVSGSMRGRNRLALVKQALEMLTNELREGDMVGIAIYGDEGAVHLPHTDAMRNDLIIEAIHKLEAGGSTNAEEGLEIGYRMASENYVEGYTNRVILCSDGVANVGATGPEGILETIVENRRKGITLSAVGVGMGGYNDHLLEQLGDKGDGHYAYVDGIDEARRIFVENLTGTLEVVGRDVKIQVEFNPDVVKSYRLIGYANRDVRDEDFRNDAVDGGEIGAGHAATALYELKLVEGRTGVIGTATIRYREDERDEFKEISHDVMTRDVAQSWEMAPAGLRLAGNVAEFAEILSESFYAKYATLEPVIKDLEAIQFEYRNDKFSELQELVKKANELRE